MIALDTSVIVPALVEAHPRHERAVSVPVEDCVAPAHAVLESYSVMTRAPLPVRTPPHAAVQALRAAFDRRIIQLAKGDVLGFLERMATAGVAAGRIYDALIAETARQAGATLVTYDRKAEGLHAAVGVEVEYL